MAQLHRASGSSPSLSEDLDLDEFPRSVSPDVAASLVRLVTRVEAMGLIDPAATIDSSRIQQVMRALDEHKIGSSIVDITQVAADPKRAIGALLRAVENSPVPRPTFKFLSSLIGLDSVAALIGVSEASARRYLNGERHTPDDVAFRLHTLAMTVADLAGSYNSYGIRRWFNRPRSQLGGRSPAQIFCGEWDPDGDDVRLVRDLAASLTAPLAS